MWAAGREFYYYQYTPSTNHTPVLEVEAYDSVARGGGVYKVSYLAYDTDPGDKVTVTLDYSVTPFWLTVDSANSQIAGVVPEAVVGSYFSFRVIATDSHGDTTGFTSDPIRVDHPSGIETMKELSIPLNFSLSQNYPNPFNPSTTIQYDVPTSSHVLLKVYNLLGQTVTTLVDEVKQPGRYAATWECRNLPTGVYFYRMQAVEFVQTKKLILLR
jgi:hypothetical protein